MTTEPLSMSLQSNKIKKGNDGTVTDVGILAKENILSVYVKLLT